MKRLILIYSLLTALLIVAIRFFEVSLFSGQITMKLYVVGIGALFLGLGILAGLKLRRRQAGKEIITHYIERPAEPGTSAGGTTEPGGSLGTTETKSLPEPTGADIELLRNDLLTARESEVLICLARGLTNREIAEKLFVSENTIKTHVNNIYSKLGVSRRTQAVFRAKELKIIR